MGKRGANLGGKMINAAKENKTKIKNGPYSSTIFRRLLRSFVGSTEGRICLDGLNQNKISEWIRSMDGINVIGNKPNKIK